MPLDSWATFVETFARLAHLAFEVLLLGVFPARGFDGHHTVRTSGGMFRMRSLAARA